MSEHLDCDPAFYEEDGAGVALIEQQRANALAALRSAPNVSVTWRDGDGTTHWAIADGDIGAAFLVLAAARAVKDVSELLGLEDDRDRLASLLFTALDELEGTF